jgi:mannose-6-phosphate isomerase-like protein (cupin superfamily)
MAQMWAQNIEEATLANTNFRTVLWTGSHSQLTVMSLASGEEIGLEVHPDHDQFLRIEAGHARVEVGPSRDDLTENQDVEDDWAVIVPAGTWHNVTNTGRGPLKLYVLYAPANHPEGTVHVTKAEADAAESAEQAG